MTASPAITFRPLTDDDLPRMHRWLQDPAVVAWWEGDDVSWEGVVETYGSANTDPVDHYLALLDGEPLGWIQCYPAIWEDDDEAYYWKEHLDLWRTAGIDYLVGEADQRGQGLGAAMIRAFVHDVLFPHHWLWHTAAAGPFEANTASWKALEKAGFRRIATLDDEEGPCVLMAIRREAVEVGG